MIRYAERAPSGESAAEAPVTDSRPGPLAFPGQLADAISMPTAQLNVRSAASLLIVRAQDSARIEVILRGTVLKPTRDVVAFKMSVVSEGT